MTSYAEALSELKPEALERSLLGCLMLDPPLLDELDINDGHFYYGQHQVLFRIISHLYRKDGAVSVDLVLDEIGRQKVSLSIADIANIVSSVTSGAYAHIYAERVREKSMRRRVAELGARMISMSQSPDNIDSILSTAESELRSIGEGQAVDTLHFAPALALDAIEEIQEKGPVPKTPTGLYDLDHALGDGLEPEDLVLVGGRPSMGKTTFGVQVAANISRTKPALVVSMEERGRKVALKQLARIANVPYHTIERGKYTPQQLEQIMRGLSQLGTMRLYVDDKPHTTMQHIRRSALRVMRKEGELGVIVIDYLQFMVRGLRSDEVRHRIGDITHECKLMARELKVPVVLLSQLSREAERRNDKRPIMSDVAESGAVERHCDIMIGLYRDDKYNTNSPDRGIAEAVLMKNRDGKIGTIPLAWIGWRFDNLNPDDKRAWEARRAAG